MVKSKSILWVAFIGSALYAAGALGAKPPRAIFRTKGRGAHIATRSFRGLSEAQRRAAIREVASAALIEIEAADTGQPIPNGHLNWLRRAKNHFGLVDIKQRDVHGLPLFDAPNGFKPVALNEKQGQQAKAIDLIHSGAIRDQDLGLVKRAFGVDWDIDVKSSTDGEIVTHASRTWVQPNYVFSNRRKGRFVCDAWPTLENLNNFEYRTKMAQGTNEPLPDHEQLRVSLGLLRVGELGRYGRRYELFKSIDKKGMRGQMYLIDDSGDVDSMALKSFRSPYTAELSGDLSGYEPVLTIRSSVRQGRGPQLMKVEAILDSHSQPVRLTLVRDLQWRKRSNDPLRRPLELMRLQWADHELTMASELWSHGKMKREDVAAGLLRLFSGEFHPGGSQIASLYDRNQAKQISDEAGLLSHAVFGVDLFDLDDGAVQSAADVIVKAGMSNTDLSAADLFSNELNALAK